MIYSGKNLREISFPLGGIGSGSIGLAGNGELIDWEIFNRPNKGCNNLYTFFAIKAEYPDGKSITKVLQGDHTKDLIGQYDKGPFRGFGFGPSNDTVCAFPHFKKVQFDGKFPLAELTFEDEGFPATVILTAFNPFIPLDADNSSIPAAFFDICIKSRENDVKYTVILSARNPFKDGKNENVSENKFTAVKLYSSELSSSDKEYGDMTVAVNQGNGICQEYWYRGVWNDGISTFWHEITNGSLPPRHYDTANINDVCSIGAQTVVSKDEKESLRFVISWNIPNNYNYWSDHVDKSIKDMLWKNYYATLFKDSTHSAEYSLENWDMLFEKTTNFCNLIHNSTLDKTVIDAVSSTLSVLKSPTVLRLEDGTFYGWEGVHEKEGSCQGTCTHVWSYAYALCFLFPELERSLRETELRYDTDEHGRMYFRSELPLGLKHNEFPPCVDGQMATIIKIYRDWKITGNTEWLKANWETTKKILEYAWNENNSHEWDKDKNGVLEGRQHHTLDMELFGPSSWLQSMYLAALKAATEMAIFLDDAEKKNEYMSVFENGRKWTNENLFNGEYFYHKIDLEDGSYTEHFKCSDYWNNEKKQLKYQISDGCEIDQMLGQWHSNICGLGDIFESEKRKTALMSMFKNNFKPSLRDFVNVWRVFALNDEGGAVMCDYPEGTNKPIIPIPYCEECMTGFEYSFAGLLISEGFIDEGLTVIRAIRDRYDGEKRNPWNEIECGSNYARPMASFALLPIFSGFEFDLPHYHLGFSPIIKGDFKSFWSVGTGWGEFSKTDKSCKISLAYGSLTLESVTLGGVKKINAVYADGSPIIFTQQDQKIVFDKVTVNENIIFEVEN